MNPWGFALLAYMLGSVPFGLLVAKAHHVDLRASGSGNIGATNALRVLGKKAGAVVLLGDMLKGAVGVYIALRFAGPDAGVLAAAAAVLGHDFPVYTGFKGGKGVATSLGVVLTLEPLLGLILVAAWLLTVAITRISSLGALVSFLLLPPLVLLLKPGDTAFLALTVFLTCLIYIRHVENIKRLIRGEESRVGKKLA
jgi:glycerol-3-phosphate acyltransferase PlsY